MAGMENKMPRIMEKYLPKFMEKYLPVTLTPYCSNRDNLTVFFSKKSISNSSTSLNPAFINCCL